MTKHDTDEANCDHDQRRAHRKNPARQSRPATAEMSFAATLDVLLVFIARVFAHSYSSVVGFHLIARISCGITIHLVPVSFDTKLSLADFHAASTLHSTWSST